MVNQQQPMNESNAGAFCSVLSRRLGEPLFATAVHNEIWLLLEYEGVWREKATVDNDLPQDVQAWLAEQTAMTTGRVQFIKQERRRRRDDLSFFVAQAREADPRLFHFSLNDYTDLLGLDVNEVLVDDEAFAENQQVQPLYLVCTNGRRDRCCALFGLETYYALQKVAGDAVWQTTHVGGHRFAANVVTFPDGAYHGRVHTANAGAFYEARERGEVLPDLLRGRSCYEKAVQAADYYLRQETGRRALVPFRLEKLERLPGHAFQVTVRDLKDAVSYSIGLRSTPSDLSRYASCSASQPEPADLYQLLSLHKMIGG